MFWSGCFVALGVCLVVSLQVNIKQAAACTYSRVLVAKGHRQLVTREALPDETRSARIRSMSDMSTPLSPDPAGQRSGP